MYYFGWLAAWELNPGWQYWEFTGRAGEASAPELGEEVRAVPRLCIRLGLGICLTTEENHGKTSVRAPEKCSAYQRRARFVWSTWPSTSGGLDWSAGTRRRRFALRATGPTLGQSRYLPSCRTKGFLASANFESKLSVRALMWSANNGTPKSSWIRLLLRYQGAPVTRRRHLDCSTWSLPTCVRAADLQAGQA